MKRGALPPLVALSLACVAQPITAVELTLLGGDVVGLDQIEVVSILIDGTPDKGFAPRRFPEPARGAPLAARETLYIWFPDSHGGKPVAIGVRGLRRGGPPTAEITRTGTLKTGHALPLGYDFRVFVDGGAPLDGAGGAPVAGAGGGAAGAGGAGGSSGASGRGGSPPDAGPLPNDGPVDRAPADAVSDQARPPDAAPDGTECTGPCLFERPQWPMPNRPNTGTPNPMRYSYAPGGPIALDEVTRLEWQRGTNGAYVLWNEAVNFCQRLDLMGTGWRVPTIIELITLIDNTEQTIDVQAFPTPPSDHWSSTPYLLTGPPGSTKWRLSYRSGVSSSAVTESVQVRCVRSRTNPAPGPRFQPAGMDEVLDLKTRLQWSTSTSPAQFDRAEAIRHCEVLKASGPWRLPTHKELLSLIDWTRFAPALDPLVFPMTKPMVYWSSSFDPALPPGQASYAVSFHSGHTTRITPDTFNWVRCVRPGP